MKYFLALLLTASFAAAQTPLRGYSESDSRAEREWETKARQIPSPARIRTYMERMSAQPHHAGSAADKAVAEYALGLLRDWGLDAHIENFEALLPYPTSRMLELVSPVKFRAKLKEPAIPEDKDSGDANQLPTFNAYSASGDVTAPLVYVNYGVPEDYEVLKRLGITVAGKIVIARYGKSWRGVKPKLAEEHGAVGCIIYSDPHEDGYFQGDVYPKGAFRPWEGVQRGSVVDMSIYPGDPLSPGWASEKGSRRLTMREAKTLMKIPVLPISYADAKPLLENLGGPVAPESWRGALPFTYHIGAGPATVHLKLDFDWSTRSLNDVIAMIPGSDFKDQWIIIGNHHDAWVNGASDPVSGASSLLETARALATLRKNGWQPRRTIVFALWDGEEFGLIGSTEWAEKHQSELERKAVVYINSDSNGKGPLSASGSHSLENFVRGTLRDLTDPVSGKKLIDSARARHHRTGAPAAEAHGFHLGPLGAGSDYVAFIDHEGISSLNLGFSGESEGVYHSIYDSMYWYTHFSDSDFIYGRALSQVTTTLVMRLAAAPLLPFQFGALARTVSTYVEEIQKAAAVNSATVDFRGLKEQLSRMETDSRAYDEQLSLAARRPQPLPPSQLAKVNETLYRAERFLTVPEGLPGRPWYKHQLYAPGLYTGYGAKTLPGVREAVEAQRWEEANKEAQVAASALKSFNTQIEDATAQLKQLNAAE
ncbi:MAG: M28 family peptidase [Bryobacteraceae bacterium]